MVGEYGLVSKDRGIVTAELGGQQVGSSEEGPGEHTGRGKEEMDGALQYGEAEDAWLE